MVAFSNERSDAISVIKSKLDELPDDRIEALAELAQAWSRPSVYSTLADSEKAEIDKALDELDRGEGVPWETGATDLEARIKAARS